MGEITEGHIGCRGNTLRLASGSYFDLCNPEGSVIGINDIAEALSKICRYGGQCTGFYSVAEHSVHVANLCIRDGHPKEACLAALLHDATEAYVGDVIKPLKIMLPEYNAIELRIDKAICQRFSIEHGKYSAIIKKYDHEMLFCEKRFLFPDDAEKWHGENAVNVVDIELKMWPYYVAKRVFLRLFSEIQASDVIVASA